MEDGIIKFKVYIIIYFQNNNLRNKSYLFDWNFTLNLNVINKLSKMMI